MVEEKKMKRIHVIVFVIAILMLGQSCFAFADSDPGSPCVLNGIVGGHATGHYDGRELDCFLLSTDEGTIAVTSELNLFRAAYPEKSGEIKDAWKGHSYPLSGERITLFCIYNGQIGETEYDLYSYGSPSNIVTESKSSGSSSSVSVSAQNALKSAKQYLNYSAFSYNGLIKQLNYEGYSQEDAIYAVDNCGADWYEQATKSAEQYLSYSAFSHDGLVKQLEYEGYTHDQAEYGVSQNGL